MAENPLLKKSEDFAVRVVKLWKYLISKHEHEMSVQVKRSGTSIGANATEAQFAQSKKDFISKMHIALKECSETQYWLRVIYRSEFISKEEYCSIYADAEELARMLSAIIKTSKEEPKKETDNNIKHNNNTISDQE